MPDARGAVPLYPAARPGGGVRWLARLDAVDDGRYRELVEPLTPIVERSLGDEVLANRALGRGRRATVRLEPWGRGRSIWARRVGAALASGAARVVLISDVAACYASVEPEVVARRLRAVGVARPGVEALERFLRDLGERGVRGLPVGPSPSAILANLVLGVTDERLRSAGLPHVRWVDDVVAFASGRREALRGYDAYRWALEELGLRENPSKTALLGDPVEIRSRLRGGTWSASCPSACDDSAP